MATAEDNENRGPELFAVGVTLVTAAGIAILLRCYARICLVKNFGFDDYCMLAAMVRSPSLASIWLLDQD